MSHGGHNMPFNNFYHDKKVLVTGDTGFKGSWLSFWLNRMGSEVYGVGLDPHTDPSNFKILRLDNDISHYTVDLREYNNIEDIITDIQPQIIFHLAAQTLVLESYEKPVETLSSNFMGTTHLLESIRKAGYSMHRPCSVVIITSDKCYENREMFYGYREEDPMGGYDIYSASKGSMELLVNAWRRSFFPPDKWSSHGISLTTARAGNVIGGGDWSDYRIAVDCVKALANNKIIDIRHPNAIRPWQHVLEPLSGYLQLAAIAWEYGQLEPDKISSYNFGPGRDSERSVKDVVNTIIKYWGSGSWQEINPDKPHEAIFLKLSTDKSWHILQWKSVWSFDKCVEQTIDWYKKAYDSHFDSSQARQLTMRQIESYINDASCQNLSWSK